MDQLDDPEDDEKIARWQISPSVLVILQQGLQPLVQEGPVAAGGRTVPRPIGRDARSKNL